MPTSRNSLALLAFLLCLPAAAAADDWQLRIDDEEAGIRVFTRVNTRGYAEFKGETKVRSSLAAFVALFKDLPHMPEWAYRVRKAENLAEVSDTEAYSYTINSFPPPLYDRDAVVRSTITQDAATQKMTFHNAGVPDYAPKNERYVRMPVLESRWTFTPVGGGMVDVEFRGYGDPGGSLSSGPLAWFVRLSLSEAPYHTMRAMKRFISRPEYQSARFSYIREAAP